MLFKRKIFNDLLKKDLAHHGQLLEHPYVVGELQKYVQNKWKEIATGRAIKFHSAQAQPCADLKDDEVCIRTMPDGIELIVTRSPLVNSNGVVILKNRHLSELMRLKGSIHIKSETAAKHFQADFDGDILAFERAEKYPNLTAEIKESLTEEKRYPEVIKKNKVPYKGASFEEIALSAMQNDIGRISNLIMSATALRHETELMPQQNKKNYVQQVSKYYKASIAQDVDPESDFKIPANYREDITVIANIPDNPNSQQIEESLQRMRDIQFKVVSDLSNELQVAVDGPKSALRPDANLINTCKEISGYKGVFCLYGKKNKEVYLTKQFPSSNHSPVDLMVNIANKQWKENRLNFRPAVQFRSIFEEVNDVNIKNTAQQIKTTYNKFQNEARSLEELKLKYPELVDSYLEIELSNTKEKLYITRLERFGTLESPLLQDKPIDINFVKNKIYKDTPNSLLAITTVEVDGKPQEKVIGALAYLSEQNIDKIPPSLKTTVTLQSGINDDRVQAIYKVRNNYVETLRDKYSEVEQQKLAAAIWHGAHTKDDYGTKQALSAFKVFPEPILKQLEQLQFDTMKLIGTQYHQYAQKQWVGEEMDCEVVLHPIPDKDNPQGVMKRVVKAADKVVGLIGDESPTLPIGTKFKANLTSDLPSSVTLTTPKGTILTAKEVKNYKYSHVNWQEQTDRTLSVVLARDDKGKQVALILLDDLGLGILDKKSENIFKEKKTIKYKPFKV